MRTTAERESSHMTYTLGKEREEMKERKRKKEKKGHTEWVRSKR
tara:strand:+ start:689 stop:820 length:132 start_codon:yes stop_codon:yes gene_type:complete